MSSRRATPVLFVGIYGTIRHGKDQLGRFVNGPNDVKVFDGVPELLARYEAAGRRICGVSNQGGIGLGIVDAARVAAAMDRTADQYGGFDRLDWCAHPPDVGCACRKPRAGMIDAALGEMASLHRREYYPRHLMLMVGDVSSTKRSTATASPPTTR